MEYMLNILITNQNIIILGSSLELHVKKVVCQNNCKMSYNLFFIRILNSLLSLKILNFLLF